MRENKKMAADMKTKKIKKKGFVEIKEQELG